MHWTLSMRGANWWPYSICSSFSGCLAIAGSTTSVMCPWWPVLVRSNFQLCQQANFHCNSIISLINSTKNIAGSHGTFSSLRRASLSELFLAESHQSQWSLSRVTTKIWWIAIKNYRSHGTCPSLKKKQLKTPITYVSCHSVLIVVEPGKQN